MKKLKKILSVVVVFFIICFMLGTKAMAKSITDAFIQENLSEEFQKYLQLSPEEQAKVIQPRPYEIQKPKEKKKMNMFNLILKAGNNLERKYTLEDVIPNNLEVKDQQDTDTCWAFYAIAALETNLALKATDKSKVYDFSERHMEYATNRFFSNNQINENGFDRKVGSGGTFSIAQAYLTNGTGAIKEEDMPFENNNDNIEISAIQNKTVCSQVYDTVSFPAYNSNDDKTEIIEEMKNHIKNYGAIAVSVFGADLINEYYNNNNAAMYCDNEKNCPINHGVAIIGWDDDFSKDNFNEAHRPKNNGAWLVKNSWGKSKTEDVTDLRKIMYNEGKEIFQSQGILDYTQIPDEYIEAYFEEQGYTVDVNGNELTMSVGKDGFMYMSYEDVNIYKIMNGIIKAGDSVDYDNIYQYDMLGSNNNIDFNLPKVYIGSNFTKKTSEKEYLTQVSLETVATTKCKVFVNPNGSSMDKNSLVEVQLKEGESETFDAGYHTIEFLNPIEIKSNDYAVVIEMQGVDQEKTSVAIEMNIENSTYDKVKIQEGKNFVGSEDEFNNNQWTDFSKINEINGNIPRSNNTIKAFTVNEIKGKQPSNGGGGENGETTTYKEPTYSKQEDNTTAPGILPHAGIIITIIISTAIVIMIVGGIAYIRYKKLSKYIK